MKLTEILDKAGKKPEEEEDDFEPERVTVIKSNNLSRKPEPEPVAVPEPEPVAEEAEDVSVEEMDDASSEVADAPFVAEEKVDAPQEASAPSEPEPEPEPEPVVEEEKEPEAPVVVEVSTC